MTILTAPSTARPLHRPVATGPAYWGPGDHYTFLITGEETGGAYFAMEAIVPPGGGPPPHIHQREDETFYLVEGEVEFRVGEETVTAGPGDFVNVPRGTVHNFRNAGTETARIVLTFTPGGHRAVLRGDARARSQLRAGSARQHRRGGGALRGGRIPPRPRVRLTERRRGCPSGPAVHQERASTVTNRS